MKRVRLIACVVLFALLCQAPNLVAVSILVVMFGGCLYKCKTDWESSTVEERRKYTGAKWVSDNFDIDIFSE